MMNNEDGWKQVMPMMKVQAMLAGSLLYLWKRFLDFYTDPIPEKWHTYSSWEIVQWCKADAEKRKAWEELLDRPEAEVPTQGKGDDSAYKTV